VRELNLDFNLDSFFFGWENFPTLRKNEKIFYFILLHVWVSLSFSGSYFIKKNSFAWNKHLDSDGNWGSLKILKNNLTMTWELKFSQLFRIKSRKILKFFNRKKVKKKISQVKPRSLYFREKHWEEVSIHEHNRFLFENSFAWSKKIRKQNMYKFWLFENPLIFIWNQFFKDNYCSICDHKEKEKSFTVHNHKSEDEADYWI